MRIAVIGTRGIPDIQGGVEKHCQSLYPRLTRDEILLYRRRPFVNKGGESYPNIRYVDLPSTHIKGFEALLHSLLASVHCLFKRTDVVHVHNMGPGLFVPLLKLFGKRVVLTYHSENHTDVKWGPAARGLLRLGQFLSLRFADRVIFVNRAVMERQKTAVRNKSCWITNGVEEPVTVPENVSETVWRRFGLEPGRYLLAVGRLTSVKGFDYLIKAVQDIASVHRLAIVGNSDNQPLYRKELEALDVKKKVVFTGALYGAELEAMYAGALMLVLPSLREGMPLVLLEAMQRSLPVICSRITGTDLPEIPDDVKFTPADREALRESLERHLPVAGTRVHYDMSRYDWTHVARQTRSVLEQASRS